MKKKLFISWAAKMQEVLSSGFKSDTPHQTSKPFLFLYQFLSLQPFKKSSYEANTHG
jgi:hypothetical protein